MTTDKVLEYARRLDDELTRLGLDIVPNIWYPGDSERGIASCLLVRFRSEVDRQTFACFLPSNYFVVVPPSLYQDDEQIHLEYWCAIEPFYVAVVWGVLAMVRTVA